MLLSAMRAAGVAVITSVGLTNSSVEMGVTADS